MSVATKNGTRSRSAIATLAVTTAVAAAVVWSTSTSNESEPSVEQTARPHRVHLEVTLSNEGYGHVTASRLSAGESIITIADRDVSEAWRHDEIVVPETPVKYTVSAAANDDNQRRGTLTCRIKVDGKERDRRSISIRPGGLSAVSCSHVVE